MNELPNHLGGHLNRTNIDTGVADWLVAHIPFSMVLDIGCGPGGMLHYFRTCKKSAVGVDGDFSINHTETVFIHDFTQGPFHYQADLIWCVEFLEHVEEQYLPNVFAAFETANWAVITAAPPGWAGHHHVNCRTQEYWKGVLAAHGWRYDEATTVAIKGVSTMAKGFMKMNGMFFERYSYGK